MDYFSQTNYPSNRFISSYINLWLIFIFITSVVVFPQIKGTTPAYMFSFIAPFAMVFSKKKSVSAFYVISLFCLYILSTAILSQGLLFFYQSVLPPIDRLVFVSKNTNLLFKPSLLTQSTYLLASFIFFTVISLFYYSIRNDKFLMLGILILISYGYYEIVYYGLFHESGDFLSNRFFGVNSSGSLYQTISFAGLRFVRFKSLTGEPSMYAFSVLPFFIYFLHQRRLFLAIIILSSLVLTFSTTAILGLVMYGTFRILKYGVLDKKMVVFAFVLIVILLINHELILDVYDKLIDQKATAQNQSGIQRGANFNNHMDFYLSLPWLLKISGLGFGYVRSTDFISTLLVNNGILGMFTFSGLFLYPIYRLKPSYENEGLKIAILITFVLMMISVPEFSYLSVWLILGISYNKLFRQRENWTS